MNIKTIKKNSGFTIVELLIVIVIIGILAAITIVAYNGIQNRAKASAAQSSANVLQKKLEAYNAVQSSYPTGTATTSLATQTESTLTNSGVSIGTPTAATGQKTVKLESCTTGYRITYWDYNAGNLPAAAQITGGATCATYTAAT
jgi:prepilin-type N-terminal cleavage/methylation domain-containing protein